MSKDKATKSNPFTIYVNGVPFCNAESVENAVGIALGLHKTSNLPHKIKVVNPESTSVVYLDA